MKTIILCGGQGTRMKEETEFRPKPLVQVGERPILWHIMKIYAHCGYRKFILALGYKGQMIKDYFLHQRVWLNDFTLDTATNRIHFHNNRSDRFQITLAETGLESLTGERILRLKKYLTEDMFMVTYGDGVADIDIKELVRFHKKHGRLATVTGVHPYSKYGLMKIDKKKRAAVRFDQKPLMQEYVNGGFMVFRRKALEYFDEGPLENSFSRLIAEDQLGVYQHNGFWKAVDTYHELEELNRLWRADRPWAVWEKR